MQGDEFRARGFCRRGEPFCLGYKKSEEIENDTVGAKTAEGLPRLQAHLTDEASESENADSGNVDFE